jgi:peptidoglycan/xylan/chitin deacetylase (PgdA/CDA1 family)
MKKKFIICACFAVFCLAIWWVLFARAGAFYPALAGEAVNTAAAEGPLFHILAPPGLLAYALPAEEESAGQGAEAAARQRGSARMIAFTFDDGPNRYTTPQLLDGLRERGVHATFFMLGTLVQKMPDIVLQAYEDGHAIGGHGYDHRAYFTKLSAESLQTQLQKVDGAISGITGEAPSLLLRPPYGAINAAVAHNTGKANILWNIDPRDWQVRDADKICNSILSHAMDGGVVIMHDIYPTSVNGALKAVDKLLEDGWELVTVPELFEAFGVSLQAGGIYRSPGVYTLPEDD